MLAFCGGAFLGCTAGSAAAGDAVDYLVQDVCVDPRGVAIAGDPAKCRRHRDLRIGEPQRYILTDYDRATQATLQASSSFPVRGSDGRTLVVVLKSLQGSFGPDYDFNFSPARDAFDLIDVSHSTYASIVRTFDGGCRDQVFSHNGSRRTLSDRSAGWVLFPLHPTPQEWPRRQALEVTTWRMQLTPKKGACSDNHAHGVTSWEAPSRHTFESGKTLTAIKSDHFAASDLHQPENSFERFYFTREYGLTRWEAWQTAAYCRSQFGIADVRCQPDSPNNPWRSRCSDLKDPTSGLVGIAYFGGQPWVRTFCRDETHYIALKRAQTFLSPYIGRGSGVLDIDYADTGANPK